MADEVKDYEEKKRRLAAGFKGDFYLHEDDYQKALAAYMTAFDKGRLAELGRICLKWGHPKIAVQALEAAGEKIAELSMIECGAKCLEWGRIHDGVFAYQYAKRSSSLTPGQFAGKYLEKDLFRKCGDAILERAEKSAERERMREDAVLAYVIAGRPDKIVAVADMYLREASLLDNAKKAEVLYDRAASLMLLPEEEPDKMENRFLFPPEAKAKDAAGREEKDGDT